MLHRIYDQQEPYCMSPSEERVLEARDEGFEKGYNQAIQEFEHKQEELMEKQTKNIYQRMIQVMEEVDFVQKGNKKVNGQYTFVSHDAVKRALHHPMAKAGIYMKYTLKEMTQDGNRTTALVEVTFYNVDNPEEKIIVESKGYGIDTQDKGPGKAVSYAVKYAMLNAFCLETGDDSDKDLNEHEPEPNYVPACLSTEQVVAIELLSKKNPEKMKLIMKYLKKEGIDHLSELPASSYNRIVESLQQPVPVAA